MPRPPATASEPHDRRRRWTTAGLAAIIAWAGALLLNRSLRRVEGDSMLPSLWPGDLLLTMPATWVRPRAGDVVVAEVGGRQVTKRLAAPPGACVELREGHLLVDGAWWLVPDAVPVEEDAAWAPDPVGAVLLGDHRARSTDARTTGPVDRDALDRVALARLVPPTRLRGRTRALDGARHRPGVRLVVLDPEDRVLLFRVTDADGGAATWWEAPGGGRRPGEPARDAAARELAEEVGATRPAPVLLDGVHVRHTRLGGADLEKVEELFAVRLTTATVDPAGWTASELRDIAEVRWWTLQELGEVEPGAVVPPDIAQLAGHAARVV